jgi:hypothetical protein
LHRAGDNRLISLRLDYTGDLITLLVGSDESKFTIHKTTLCNKSAYFKSALTGDWKEGEENIVWLPEQDVGSFAKYTHWAYTGSISLPEKGVVHAEVPASLTHWSMIMCKLAILADYLGDGELHDNIVTHLISVVNGGRGENYIDAETTSYVIENTTETSKFRRLVFDIWTTTMDASVLEAQWQKYPAELLYELAKWSMTRSSQETLRRPALPRPSKACENHLHQHIHPSICLSRVFGS